MTSGVAAARVWLAVAGVVLGIVTASSRPSLWSCLTVAVIGALLLSRRRRPGLAAIGIVLLCAGLSASRPPPAPIVHSFTPPATAFGDASRRAFDGAPPDAAALLAGLTIGDTSGIDYPTSELFRRSGLAHLVAVSGSNVAIVLAAVAVTTARLPLAARGFVAVVVLSGYVSVVGMEPSVLRAAAMGTVGVIAFVAGARAAPLNSLGIAAIVVVSLKPELLFAVGFHLSVTATLGIVLWARALEARLQWLPALLRVPVAITLAAQIAVAPVIVGAFEKLSLVAPVANVLAAPAVPPATLLGLAAGAAGMFVPDLGAILGRIAAPFATWILFVARETGAWSWASISVDSTVGWVAAIPLGVAAIAAAVRGAGR